MTGPEYASAWVRIVKDADVDYLTDATVTDIRRPEREGAGASGPAETGSAGFVLKISSFSRGMEEYFCRAVILASGCRERSRGQLRIPGKPAGRRSIRPVRCSA